jgi:integrase
LKWTGQYVYLPASISASAFGLASFNARQAVGAPAWPTKTCEAEKEGRNGMVKMVGGKVRRRVWTSNGKRHESWGWTIEVDGRQVRRQGWTCRADAQDALEAYKVEVKKPAPTEEAKPELTLAEAFVRYFEAKVKKRSLADDRRLSEHLIAEFGEDTPLRAITANRIAAYKAKRLATRSALTKELLAPATVNRALALLRHLLHLARDEWEAIASVPRIKLEREPEGRLRWATPEEANRLLDACRKSRTANLPDLVELSLFTGLRRGEVLGLTWDRVDRARGVILLEITKAKRRRAVPLNSQADAVLARRGPKDAGLVFGSRNWDRYRTAWENAVQRARLENFHWHDLRHTFASWAVQQGPSLQEVKELLGHRSMAMVLRYAHLSPEHLRAAVSALDGILGGSTTQSTYRAHSPSSAFVESAAVL